MQQKSNKESDEIINETSETHKNMTIDIKNLSNNKDNKSNIEESTAKNVKSNIETKKSADNNSILGKISGFFGSIVSTIFSLFG